MRHQAETEQMTRLLIQKPAAYAELEEYSRIVLSGLTEAGWSIDRVEMDLQVRVAITVPIEKIDENAALASELSAAQARFIMLRAQVVENTADQWLAIAMGCVVCAALDWFGLGHWDMLAAAGAVAMWRLVKWYVRRKASQ